MRDINAESEGAVLAGLLAPVVIRRTGGAAEDEQALLFGQSPQIRNGQESPQAGALSRFPLAGANRELSRRRGPSAFSDGRRGP